MLLQYYVNVKQVKKHRSFSCYNSGLGFTLIELIASLLIGSIILGAALGGFFSLKQLFNPDEIKTEINQKLRSTFGIIGPDILQIGEGLTSNPNFPAFEVRENPNSDRTDSSITIRKADQIGSLSICQTIDASNRVINIINTNSGCPPGNDEDNDGLPDNLEIWQRKRIQNGGSIRAFIFNQNSGEGEFFDYTDEDIINSTTINLQTTSTLTNSYPSGSSFIYLLEERTYSVDDNNRITLRINDNEDFVLTEGIENLNATVSLQSRDAQETCSTFPDPVNCQGFDSWNQIQSVNIEVTVEEPDDDDPDSYKYRGIDEDDRTLSQNFLPRNRLSF